VFGKVTAALFGTIGDRRINATSQATAWAFFTCHRSRHRSMDSRPIWCCYRQYAQLTAPRRDLRPSSCRAKSVVPGLSQAVAHQDVPHQLTGR
jgi:hypothetical protein